MTHRLSLPDLEALARDSLLRAGVPESAARATAAEIAAAEAAGERACGMEALLRDLRLIRYGRIAPAAAPRAGQPRPGLLMVDACHGLAAAALAAMTPRFAEMARAHGVALLCLDDASDPGLMICATRGLAEHGLTATAFGADGPGRRGHPDRPASAPLSHPPRDALSMLLKTPSRQPSDSPFGGGVAHGAWVLAVDPAAAGDAVPEATDQTHAPPSPPAHEVALTSELLEQIVSA